LLKKGVISKGEDNQIDICGKKMPSRGRDSKFLNVKEACCATQHENSTGDCDSAAWPKG